MGSLKKFLLGKKFFRHRVDFMLTNHMLIQAKINGITGDFILDTGASNSCVGFAGVAKFKLAIEDSSIIASGAGSDKMETKVAQKNCLELGQWSQKDMSLLVLDLSHINDALVKQKSQEIDGILGADILRTAKAILDYGKKYLYLK